jgi:hypothetical protein
MVASISQPPDKEPLYARSGKLQYKSSVIFLGYLRSSGSVTVPGFQIARRVAPLGYARGSTPRSFANSISEWSRAV